MVVLWVIRFMLFTLCLCTLSWQGTDLLLSPESGLCGRKNVEGQVQVQAQVQGAGCREVTPSRGKAVAICNQSSFVRFRVHFLIIKLAAKRTL
jgi:hypothetical protein